MDTKRIEHISLILFILSILCLIWMRLFYRIPYIHPSDISRSMDGKEAVVFGAVTSVSHHGRMTFLKLDGFPVVFFSNVSASRGEMLWIYGKVQIYQGELELAGKRIIKRKLINS